MPRFVLLFHECPPSYDRPSHWDLMLEAGEMLRTWALDRLPHDWSAAHSRTAASVPDCPAVVAENGVVAVQLRDHRRNFLEFDGPLSANRGTVKRVAAGTYSIESESPDCWRIALNSDEISGIVALTRSRSEDTKWTLESLPAR
jgi:hypothetical protein